MFDEKFLEQCVAKIKVTTLENEDVEVVNESPLEMLGKGRQGAVYTVTPDICVKVFGNQEDCDREYYALSLGQHTDLFPKVYHKGPLHIAMEIIRGVDLREYLQSQPLSKSLSVKLIDMLITFKEIGYERIDHHKRQIYLQKDGSLKVIDVARTVWRDRVYPYPRKLLNSLGQDNKEVFLTHVQEWAPTLYQEWLHYIRMEELSQEIYQLIMEEDASKTETVKAMSHKLLTREDEERYVVLMYGLMHKVFKEQWIRTMIAKGVDPNEILEAIDEYWDEQKREFKELEAGGGDRKNQPPRELTKEEKKEQLRQEKLRAKKEKEKQRLERIRARRENREKNKKGKAQPVDKKGKKADKQGKDKNKKAEKKSKDNKEKKQNKSGLKKGYSSWWTFGLA